MSRRMKQPVACERSGLELMAQRLKNFKGCANPERLTILISRLDWLLETNEIESIELTFAQFQKRLAQWLTVKQVEHAIYQLRDLGLLIVERREHGMLYSIPELGETFSRTGGIASPELGESHLVLENSNRESSKQAPPTRGKQAKIKAKPLLAPLEEQLPEEALEAWEIYKNAAAAKRKSGVAESVLAGLLSEFIEITKKHELDWDAFAHGLRACLKAKDGPAENATYFRKAACGYQPDNGYSPAYRNDEPYEFGDTPIG